MDLSAPVLPHSWKNRYPFRTGTTSFIFPAGYAENVDRLGPYLDEIELLMFESRPESRPDPVLVERLAALADALAVTYNVHLPVDLDLTHHDKTRRSEACRVMRSFIETLLPLNPSVFVLHLGPPDSGRTGQPLERWQRRAAGSLAEILALGLPGRRLALENLFFPFDWLDPLLVEHDLSVCLDTGHLALRNQDLAAFLAAFGERIAILHLHGVQNGRDHAPLTALPASYRPPLTAWLARFQGTVSLEVFALDALRASLTTLDEMMAPIL